MNKNELNKIREMSDVELFQGNITASEEEIRAYFQTLQ